MNRVKVVAAVVASVAVIVAGAAGTATAGAADLFTVTAGAAAGAILAAVGWWWWWLSRRFSRLAAACLTGLSLGVVLVIVASLPNACVDMSGATVACSTSERLSAFTVGMLFPVLAWLFAVPFFAVRWCWRTGRRWRANRQATSPSPGTSPATKTTSRKRTGKRSAGPSTVSDVADVSPSTSRRRHR